MGEESSDSLGEKGNLKTHKDLDAWKMAMEVVERVYACTSEYPKEEIYGLALQTRRSAVSVPSNIAEGAARNSKKEFIQFLYISLGSLAELETQLLIADRLAILKDQEIFQGLVQARKCILGLIRHMKSKV